MGRKIKGSASFWWTTKLVFLSINWTHTSLVLKKYYVVYAALSEMRSNFSTVHCSYLLKTIELYLVNKYDFYCSKTQI